MKLWRCSHQLSTAVYTRVSPRRKTTAVKSLNLKTKPPVRSCGVDVELSRKSKPPKKTSRTTNYGETLKTCKVHRAPDWSTGKTEPLLAGLLALSHRRSFDFRPGESSSSSKHPGLQTIWETNTIHRQTNKKQTNINNLFFIPMHSYNTWPWWKTSIDWLP